MSIDMFEAKIDIKKKGRKKLISKAGEIKRLKFINVLITITDTDEKVIFNLFASFLTY